MSLYSSVGEYLENRQMEDLKALLQDTDTHELVTLLKELSEEQRVLVFRLLQKDRAIEIFELLDKPFQQSLISSFAEKRAKEVFTELDPDDQANLLDELPAKITNKLMESLPKNEREHVFDLLGYERETAGRIMTPEYVNIKKEQKVSEALSRVRSKGHNKETIYTLYVTDGKRKLEGVVSLRDLLMSSDDKLVEELMEEGAATVSTGTDQEEAARLLKEHDLLSVPVVDREDRLVGIITVDDALDILEEETTEDLFERVGLTTMAQQESGRSLKLLEGSLPQIWRVRIPFLLVTLMGGMMAGLVLEHFEETLQSVAALAFFIPVIMDMGGNVGTQSSTIFTRALVLGHINIQSFLKNWLKEVGVGLSMGVMLGIGAGFIAHFWQGIQGLGLVVGISLAATVTLASAMGFLVPFVLVKLGMDQAAGADPFLTTIKDITALAIYFSLTNIFLGYLL